MNATILRRLLPLLIAICTTALLAQPLPRIAPETAGVSAERLNRLTATLDGYVASGQLPGGVVMIARDGKLIYARPFGMRDREAAAPMREDTIFRIASQSKALVSTAILMLQDEGKLVIGDPLWKTIPEFRNTTVAVKKEGGYDVVPAKRAITLRDLLTHSAGIGYGWGAAADRWKAAGIQGWYFADRDEPIEATVLRMASLPMDAHPGEAFVYGYAMDILGVVVERVSGMPLDQFLRTRITEPLGMNDTHFYLPAAKRDRLATVYSRRDALGLERAPDVGTTESQGAYVEGPRKSFSGGAGLVSTAGDYLRLLQMIANGGELDGVRILSRKTVELMTADHLGAVYKLPGQGFGLGFSVATDLGLRGVPGSAGEFGWGGAYHSVYWVDPRERLAVVYLTQVIPARNLDDHAKLRALVYQALD
ncbi:MAG: serine hydrolase domain-containing protein [Thermoanaerobaculia bacterium]